MVLLCFAVPSFERYHLCFVYIICDRLYLLLSACLSILSRAYSVEEPHLERARTKSKGESAPFFYSKSVSDFVDMQRAAAKDPKQKPCQSLGSLRVLQR